MESSGIITIAQATEFEGLRHGITRRERAKLRLADVTEGLNPAALQEREALIKSARQRMRHLTWYDSNNLDGDTLPDSMHEPIVWNGDVGKRHIDASPWIPVDNPADDQSVELQVRVHRDETSRAHENDHGRSRYRSMPEASIWVRLRHIPSDESTAPEELFAFPSYDERDVTCRGDSIELYSPYWYKLDEALTDIEAWRQKPAATSA